MPSTNQEKYESNNPFRKLFLSPFQSRFLSVLESIHPADVLEVGSGEGFLLHKIHERLPSRRVAGVEFVPEYVVEGRRLFPHLDLRQGDIYRLNEPDRSWDVVVASEVLEHLDRPEDALKELACVSRRYLLLSVPWEPWFRLLNFARGKHVRRFGNHPEHINNWSQKSFQRFVAESVTVERIIPSFPWTIVLARVA